MGNYIGRPDANQRGGHTFIPRGVTISCMNIRKWPLGLVMLWAPGAQAQSAVQTVRVPLKQEMIRAESELATFSGLVDEQDAIGDPPKAAAKTPWQVASQNNKQFPLADFAKMLVGISDRDQYKVLVSANADRDRQLPQPVHIRLMISGSNCC